MIKPEEIKRLIDADRTSERKQRAAVGQRYYEGQHDILQYRMFYYADLFQGIVNCTPAKGRVWPVAAPAEAFGRAYRTARGRGSVAAEGSFSRRGYTSAPADVNASILLPRRPQPCYNRAYQPKGHSDHGQIQNDLRLLRMRL